MDKANIFLCLLSHENGAILQNRHFPLAIGLISEYLKANLDGIDTYLFKRPSLLSKVLNDKKPSVVMFSSYLWNEKLNCFYAKYIKQRYPNTLVIFGGPNISDNDSYNINFLKSNPQIDIFVRGDGELVSKMLIERFLEHLDIEKLKTYDNGNTLAILKDSGLVVKGKNELEYRIGVGDVMLDDVPSPYLTGAFDIFFEDAAIALLETNRGCPYGCTYCQQGSKYFSKIRYYDDSRIRDELYYIAKKISRDKLNMSIIEFADPNFGMYKNDTKIFEHIREVQDRYNFPTDVWCSTGKSRQNLILSNARILKDDSIMIRAAVQSLNKKTLKTVKRKNLDLDIFDKLTNNSHHIDIYSDLMLGLPFETRKSYVDGVYKLIDFGVTEFSMPQTILLKGTPMEEYSYIEEHDIATKNRVIPECDGIYSVFNHHSRVTENEKVIVSTKTLSFDDYLECRKFNLLVMVFHNTRILSHIYIYLESIGINRSKILEEIMLQADTDKNFRQICSMYLHDTKEELSDAELEFDDDYDIESKISNKIYKYLAIILFLNKLSVVALIKCSLLKIVKSRKKVDILTKITSSTIVDSFDIDEMDETIYIDDVDLKKIFGCKLKVYYSKQQYERIATLKNIYVFERDRINKLAYHLRPINMIKKVELFST